VNLRRTRAMAGKELRHIWRDPRSLMIALALPVLMLLLFGYALSLDVDQIPTLIFDSDGSPESRALIARFEGSRYFEILGFVDDYRTIESSIDRDECLIAVVIPKDFSRKLLTGKEAQVQLIIDGSEVVAAGDERLLCGAWRHGSPVAASVRLISASEGILSFNSRSGLETSILMR